MKKSKFLALILAIAATFSLTVGITSFATEETDTVSSEATTDSTTTQTVAVSEIGGKMSSYTVKNPAVKFTLPADFNCVTVDSASADISVFGVSKADFISYGYVAYGTTDDSSSYFYLTRTQDDYSKLVGDYNKLSKDELDEVVTEMAETLDQTTYTPAFDSAESVKINGQVYVKTTTSSTTSSSDVKIIEYNTVNDGYNYTISYIYPSTISEESVKNFTGTIDSFKFSFSLDTDNILSYVTILLSLVAIALSIVAIVKCSGSKKASVEELAEASDEETEDENYYGFDETNGDEAVETAETVEETTEEVEAESDTAEEEQVADEVSETEE